MLARLENTVLRLRRAFSRSRWLTRLLGLSISRGSPNRPGLLLIQIDGLSRRQLERALDRGEMPFLKRLLSRESYQLHSHYAGLPASTPAVQAELFYGIKCAVPAFSFLNRETGQVVRMYEPDAASRVQQRLEAQSEQPLLTGGSAYSNCFTGGAAEAHFCPSALGWGPPLRRANPLVLFFLFVISLYAIARIGVLLALELVIGMVDFLRGLVQGRDFLKEFKFVPTRVAICILLRELCVLGGKVDLHRGLPIVHINLLGYDEQSHRRGPDSLFAHWTLKGIDDAIARLWRAAHRAPWRHYEVWIYSDHGQCSATAYEKRQGYSIDMAISEAFGGLANGTPYSPLRVHRGSVETQRVRLLGGNRFQRLFAKLGLDEEADEQCPQVTALGPVGFVYLPHTLNPAEYGKLARRLVAAHRVPVAIHPQDDGSLLAWTSEGEYRLPRDMGRLFGEDHPFLAQLGEDLVRLCLHENAGELTLLGWHKDAPEPVTFALEHGTHAGLTDEETHGFCLLPENAPVSRGQPYLRPTQLREAALAFLHRRRSAPTPRPRRIATPTQQLRIMTYNAHSCMGMDGKLNAERIARVIARANPDVVALQELDVGRSRTGGEDQAHSIAHYLEMDFHFHPAIHLEEEKYGDAILTHLPVELVRSAQLPGLGAESGAEPRGALWVTVDLHGTKVHIINTHLGLSPRERLLQTEALLGRNWLGDPRCREPVILCGDFNAIPSSRPCRILRRRLDDVQLKLEGHRPRNTFYSRFPTARIDYIFVDPAIEVTSVEVPRSQLTLVASDHLPLVTELSIPSFTRQDGAGGDRDGDSERMQAHGRQPDPQNSV